MTHTKGPWKAVCEDRIDKPPMFDGDDGHRFWTIQESGIFRGGVATVHSSEHINGITLQERDANAHLIAASPDLLSAAKGALFVLQIVNSREPGTNEQGAIAHLEQAIAKAEGK